MPRESYAASGEPLPPVSIPEMAARLDFMSRRLQSDAAEIHRVSAMSNAIGKINGIVKNDLQRLRQMGERPNGANQIIPYHPPVRP